MRHNKTNRRSQVDELLCENTRLVSDNHDLYECNRRMTEALEKGLFAEALEISRRENRKQETLKRIAHLPIVLGVRK